MKKYKTTLKPLIISLMIGLSSCDSSVSFNTTRADSTKIPVITANLSQTQAGTSIVRIPTINAVPEDIRNSSDIKVVFDNSKSTISVTRNSDGSLSFPTTNSVRIDSEGNFNVLFLVDGQKSYLTTIKTGPILRLKNPGVLVSPNNGSVIRGEKVRLSVNTDVQNKSDYIFNWFYGGSSVGQFTPISGTSDTVEFTPPSVGNYYVKLDIIDRNSGATSTYVSPVASVFVSDANNIINSSSSTILRGKQTTLTANIPNADNFTFTWSYGVTPQGPFMPIAGNTKNVDWTPAQSGSFYIKLEALNKTSGEVSTYTTTDPEVFVTENEGVIITDPLLGNIVRGNSIKLSANVNSNDNSSFSWSYAPSIQGPWQAIPGSTREINWTPPAAGSFFVKVDVVDGQSNNVSTFISPKAIVFVTEATNIFRTEPLLANIKRGSFVNIFANIPGAEGKKIQYNWSASTSGLPGSFQPLRNIKYDINSNTIRWRPDTEGSYFIKVDAVNIDNQSVSSFTSTTPIVFVNEITPLFTTDPASGKILQDSNIDIMVDLQYTNGSTFAWSYGPSTQGPWFSIGGSNINKITWDKKNRAGGVDPRTGVYIPGSEGKPAGTYYVKVDLTDNSTDKATSTFVSKSPILFVERVESVFNNNSSFGQGAAPTGLNTLGN